MELLPALLCTPWDKTCWFELKKKTNVFLASLQNDDEDFNYVIAFFLGTAACLYQVSDGQWANDGPLLNRDAGRCSSAACQQGARQQRSLIST